MTRKGVAPAVAAGVGLVLLLLAGAAAFSMVNEGFFSIGQGEDLSCEMVSLPQDSVDKFSSMSEAKQEFQSSERDESWESFKSRNNLQVVDGVVKAERCWR
jgi:hypothetical protein